MKRFGYEYNKRNLMKKVTDWASRVTNYTYDDAGQLATASYPNSTSIAYTYDNNGQIKDIKYKDSGGSTTHDIAYKRDNLENPTIITDTIGSTTTVKNFTYDDLSQLTDAVYDANNSEAFQYDAVGNRTVLTATVDGTATTTNYSYDEDNRMTAAGTITYTWDNNGDMLSKTDGITTTEYTYDYEKRLTQIADGTNTCQYTYNGDGLRTSSNVNGNITNWTWDTNGDLPKIIQDGTNTYLYGVGLILKGNSGAQYYYADALGSTRALANDSGTVVASYDYKAFGDMLSSSGSADTYMRYTGQQSDPESGLYYLRARYYDPTTGRFLTVDPKPALNLYIYADNRPTASADPSGMGTGMENPYARAPWWAGLLMGAGIPLAAMGGAYAVGVVAEAGPAIVSKLMAPAAGGIGVAKAFVSKAQLQQIAQKVDTAGAVLDRKRVYYNTSNLTGETCTNEILNWKRGDEIIGTIHRVYDAAGTLIHEDWDAALVNGTFYLPK